jgi:hypothetical protein
MTMSPLRRAKLVVRYEPVNRPTFQNRFYWIERTCNIANPEGIKINGFFLAVAGNWIGYVVSVENWTKMSLHLGISNMPLVVQLSTEPILD